MKSFLCCCIGVAVGKEIIALFFYISKTLSDCKFSVKKIIQSTNLTKAVYIKVQWSSSREMRVDGVVV